MNAIRHERPQGGSNTSYSEKYDGGVLKWDSLARWTNVRISPEDKEIEGLVVCFMNTLEKNLSRPGSDEVANCAVDIVKPLLGGFSEEEQCWMKREIKNICSDVEGCIAKPYRRLPKNRYITFTGKRDTSRGSYDGIDSERMWFDVSYTAGIEGLPDENDVINTRTSHIANVHHLLVSFLLNLAMFQTSSLHNTERHRYMHREQEIWERVWVIQTILRWAGNLKGRRYDLEGDNAMEENFAVGHLPDVDRAFREHYAKAEIMLRQLYWQHERGSFDDSSDGGDSNEGNFHQGCSDDQEMVDAVGESSGSEGVCLEETLQKHLDCFYSLIGRRILLLAICYYGRGSQLSERMGTIKSWEYAKLRSNRLDWEVANREPDNFESDLQSSNQLQVSNTETLNYPHRVIDITTLEFETEYSFYKGRYAIFSHTWSQREPEITFKEAKQVLLIGKINRLEQLIADLGSSSDPQAAEKLRQARIKIEACRTKAQAAACCEGAKAAACCTQAQPVACCTKAQAAACREGAQISNLASSKLLCAIEAARKLGYRYIWLDNCCIDKSNKDEFDEAIPSMGNWYRRAQACLVYLEDFYQSKISQGEPYAKSVRWATRSWTLQEIVLCPSAVIYNQFWEILYRYDRRAGDQIPPEVPDLCGVPKSLFCCGRPPSLPAHKILELAAHRKATVPEDRVYSLLGILGVRMKPECGEGLPAAIARLFEVIVEIKNDISVFNWKDTLVTAHTAPGRSMFPNDLVRCMYLPNPIQSQGGEESGNHQAKSALTVTSAGIRTQFDVLNIARVDVSNSQERDSLSVFKRLETLVKKSAGALPSLVSVRCNFILDLLGNGNVWSFLPNRMTLGVDLRCDVSLLIEKFKPSPTVIWLLARFANIKTADWFIFQIADFRKYGSHHTLAELRKQAAESSGLHARRIGIVENTHFEQAYQEYCAAMRNKAMKVQTPTPGTLEFIVE